jgi:hypothetical protein
MAVLCNSKVQFLFCGDKIGSKFRREWLIRRLASYTLPMLSHIKYVKISIDVSNYYVSAMIGEQSIREIKLVKILSTV